ncbi:hypothetical protein JCM3770_003492 [Rhodotorula araucariae]
MPDSDATLALVDALAAHVAATLALVKRPSRSPSPSCSPPPRLADIRNDVLAHLDAASQAVTQASLALKPPAALDAAHASLAKLTPTLAQLRFALELLPASASAPTLARKLAWAAQTSLDALAHFLAATGALVRTTPAGAAAGAAARAAARASQKKARDAQLVATKGFWSSLERARALPDDETAAERETWHEVLQLLDDCADEVRALAHGDVGAGAGAGAGADAEGDNDNDDDEDDDEDDDDEREGSEPLTRQERDRAAAALQLVRLARLLLAHLHARTAAPASPPRPPPPAPSPAPSPSPTPMPTPTPWRAPAFAAHATALAQALSAQGDDLAGVLDAGQDVDDVVDAADALCAAAEALASAMEGALDEGAARGSEREWLAMWRKQRDAARDKLAAI